MNTYIIKKAIRKGLRPVVKIFTKNKTLKEENEKLNYQLEYLKSHIDPQAIKPATGILRDYQLQEVQFLKEILELLSKYDIKPFFDGGCLLGYCRHNGFVPWDDDIDINLMREDFNRLLEIMKKDWLFIEMDKLTDLNHPFSAFYDKVIKEHPGQIAVVHSSTCIHIFRGSSLKDAVNVEIFPYDYVTESVTDEEFIEYKSVTSKKIKKLQNYGLKKVFDFYNKELASEKIFSKTKTNRITYGLGDFAFLNYRFRGFLQYDDIFPLQEVDFEGIKVYIPNKPQRALKCLYGDFMKLPKDIGISQALEDTNSYLKSRHKDIIDYKNIQ